MPDWKIREPSLPLIEGQSLEERVSSLALETRLSALAIRVSLNRGLDSAESIQNFLSPRLEQLTPPFAIQDLKEAADRLILACEQREHVRVYADYDVDGTTGAALLTWFFRDLDFVFDVRQPDRFKDGYGLNVPAVEAAHGDGVKILLTVDCGITSFDAAARAKELGIELIIVDHHQIDVLKGLPVAFAVVNPQRADCTSGLKQLCGCGLAFYLSLGIRNRARVKGWFAPGLKKEPTLKNHLDLVVIATAADQVPLTGDNRILVRHGLSVLRDCQKPGLKAMLEVAGVQLNRVSPGHLGFVLGPRINASGRMESASIALELLTTRDAMRGRELALEIEKLNQERADLQNKIWDDVRVQVQAGIESGKFTKGVVIGSPHWHEGVIGIVASRVTEQFRMPAVVIAVREDGLAKGSARSFGGKDVLQALRMSAEHLIGFGGHVFAAGCSLLPTNIEAFNASFNLALESIQAASFGHVLWIEGDCAIEDLTLSTLEELENLGPFGPGNPEPVFFIQAEVKSHIVMKGRHLKLQVGSPHPAKMNQIEAVWFHAAEQKDIMENLNASEQPLFFAGVPEINRFRGKSTPSFRIRDWSRPQPTE